MTDRAHLALRLAAIAVIAAASLVHRGSAATAKGPHPTLLTASSEGRVLARR